VATKQVLLSTGDVAKRAGVTRTTVLHWIKSGKLHAALTTAGGHYRISEADLQRFFAEHDDSQAAEYAKKFILVVDDEPAVRDVLVKLLQPAFSDWNIETASDGVDAGMKLLRLAPDLLILDLMLPGIDGFEVCRLVRGDPELRNTSILCITGYNRPGIYEQAIEAGADDCLFKPLDIAVLRQRVQELLDKHCRASSAKPV
jgi:excisionase family DNA binding protein